MKIRTDYVSNSSSSSFVIVGKVFSDVDGLMDKLVKDKGKLLEDLNHEYGSECESIEEFIELESFSEVLYRVLENAGLDFQIAQRDWGEDVEEVLVGYDMKSGDNKMKDTETLKEYKTRVVDALNEKGLDAKYDEVDIVTGGSDASGSTFFNECG
jgi:hypothetical protein